MFSFSRDILITSFNLFLDMAVFPLWYENIIDILVYVAVIFIVITAKDDENRLKYIIAVAGFFAIAYLLPVHFVPMRAFIAAWLILVGIPLIISKEMALLLLLIATLLPASNPLFFVINFLFYVIILGDFLHYAFDSMRKKLFSST